jgi:hypothetical protein
MIAFLSNIVRPPFSVVLPRIILTLDYRTKVRNLSSRNLAASEFAADDFCAFDH